MLVRYLYIKNGKWSENVMEIKMLFNMKKLLICRPAATTPVPEWPQEAAIVSERREAGCAIA